MTDTFAKIKPQTTSSRPSFSRLFDRFLKRAFDICAAVLGLICLAPFFVLIAVLIKRESRGPVYYRGRRAGQHGKEFLILKFLTMYERPGSYRCSKGLPCVAPRTLRGEVPEGGTIG